MEKTTSLDGWKKLLVTASSTTALGLDALPDRLVWPFVTLAAAYLIGQSIADAAKAWGAK